VKLLLELTKRRGIGDTVRIALAATWGLGPAMVSEDADAEIRRTK
jgi:hypothetical protein